MLFRQEKSSFKKVQKIEIFHVFWPKMVIFLIAGFWENPGRKDPFFIFRIEK